MSEPSAPAEQAEHPEDETSGLKRHVGRTGLLFAGVGSIIGSGWLFGSLEASQLAGPAAIISWVLGGLMILTIALTFAELGMRLISVSLLAAVVWALLFII